MLNYLETHPIYSFCHFIFILHLSKIYQKQVLKKS